MIRPLTALTALLAAASGLYLYQAKHRTQLLDNQIAQILDRIRTDKSRIAVLSAEWALENAPSRLADLASRYLTLQPMHPDQAIRMADVDSRLPPVAADGAAPFAPPGDSTPSPAVVAAMQALAAYSNLAMLTQPAAVPPPTPVTASREPVAVATAAPLAAPSVAPAPTQISRVTAVAAVAAVRPAPSPASPPSSFLRPSPHPAPVPVLASALGGSYPNLPPPTPLAPAARASESR